MRKTVMAIACLAFQAVFLTGCSSDNTLLPEVSETKKIANEYSIPLSDAVKIADAFMCNIDKGTRTERTISKVEVKTSRATRSGIGADTLLYLINYADNNGFALVAADKRLPAIYAISDEGHFEFADTLQNDGLAFFMKTVQGSINNSIEKTSSVIPGGSSNWPQDYYKQFKWYYDLYTPKLKNAMSIISQGKPYNKYCIYNNDTIFAGCAPVAIATLMSFYKWPEEYHGYKIKWDEIVSGENKDAMARVIRFLWNPDNLNVSIHTDSKGVVNASALAIRFAPTLRNMGYEVLDGLKPFNADEVLEVLRRGADTPAVGTPVLARGTTLDENGKEVGHAWVIDGAMWQHGHFGDLPPSITDPEPHYNPNIPMCLFHCVWGWGGSNNGFFNFDSNVLGGTPDYYGEYDNKDPKTTQVFYDLKYIGYIKRQQ
ncbi:MAG: C10 family peptidase [Muribaculaceae bacterium]|nr:C10 family peptidase [Muribaculaceae bacterium]